MVSENKVQKLTGHLQEKNGRWQMVVNLKVDKTGLWSSCEKWSQKWKSTGLLVKGNKTKANQVLKEYIVELENHYFNVQKNKRDEHGLLFSEYMKIWLKEKERMIEETTLTSYRSSVTSSIVPYFEKKNILLAELTTKDVKEYHTYLLEKQKISEKTLRKYNSLLVNALKLAKEKDLITDNPAYGIRLPKVKKYFASYYSSEELKVLFDKLAGHWLEPIVVMTAFYGLRRSEVLGLKWSAVDFQNDTFVINHTLVEVMDEKGNKITRKRDKTKSKSSYRSYPLSEHMKKLLLKIKQQQEVSKKVCKSAYNKKDIGYIFTNKIGKTYRPQTVSQAFKRVLEKEEMKMIRFHDLRHSCASIQLIFMVI